MVSILPKHENRKSNNENLRNFGMPKADLPGAPPSRYGGRRASMAARPSVQPWEHTAPQRVRPLRKRVRCDRCSLSSPIKRRTTCAPAQIHSSPALEPRKDKGTARAAQSQPGDDCGGLTQAQRKGRARSPSPLPRGRSFPGLLGRSDRGAGSRSSRRTQRPNSAQTAPRQRPDSALRR